MQSTVVVQLRVEDQVKQKEDDSIDEQFICLCCTNVVYQPQECGQCQKWFCTHCINKWLPMGNQKCPNCKQNWEPSDKLHIYLRNKLEEYKFKCKKCEAKDPNSEGAQVMSYSKYSQHISAKCPCVMLKCPYQCDPNLFFQSQEELQKHLFECPKGFQECPKCGIECSNQEFTGNYHDCIVTLKNIIQDKNDVIDRVIMENKQLKEQLRQYQQHDGVLNQQVVAPGVQEQQNPFVVPQGLLDQIGQGSNPYSSSHSYLQMQMGGDSSSLQDSQNPRETNQQLHPQLQQQIQDQINELNLNSQSTLINECFSGHPLQRHRTRDHQMSLTCAICSTKDIQNTVEYWACEKQDINNTCFFYICVQCRYE